MKAFGRRPLVLLLGAGALRCSSKTEPPRTSCGTPGTGPGLDYCLVAPRRLTFVNGASLNVGEVAIMAADDNTGAIVARDAMGFYGLSATCTHQCCLVALCGDAACGAVDITPNDCAPPRVAMLNPSDAAFICPCHGSIFAADGSVVSGPAQSALPSIQLVLQGDDVVVDLSTPAAPGDRVGQGR